MRDKRYYNNLLFFWNSAFIICEMASPVLTYISKRKQTKRSNFIIQKYKLTKENIKLNEA